MNRRVLIGVAAVAIVLVGAVAGAAAIRLIDGRGVGFGAAARETPATAEVARFALGGDADFIAPPIPCSPTANSVTMNVVAARPMSIAYEYGTEVGAFGEKTAAQRAEEGIALETRIEGLKPGTRYYWRLLVDGASKSEGSFTTAREPGETFTFEVQADSHPERTGKQFDASLYSRVLSGVAGDAPDFYMTLGDDFSVDTLKSATPAAVNDIYLKQRQQLAEVGAPLFLVNGNHEQAALVNLNGTADNIAVWAGAARNALFSQPAPDGFYTGDEQQVQHLGQLRDYYAFEWGDALFVVIDPYWHSKSAVDNAYGSRDKGGQRSADATSTAGGGRRKGGQGKGGGKGSGGGRDVWNSTLGDEQYGWLKETLESSDAAHKYVFAHHVLGTGRGGVEGASAGEWGDVAGLSANRPGWDATIQQLFEANDVSVFFQGHDHIFAKQELGGVVYQTLPSPADPNYALLNDQAYRTGDKLPNSGRLRVTVSPTSTQVEYVRSYLDRPDEVAYTYTLER